MSLDAIRTAYESLSLEASEPLDWPEVGLRLNLDARKANDNRQAMHIQQMCLSHGTNFRRSNFVRLAYLAKFYLTEAEAENPLGIAGAARAVLETHVFLRHVQFTLASVAVNHVLNWRQRGGQFFDELIRARFATKDSQGNKALQTLGLPKHLLTPHRVAECIASTQAKYPDRFSWLKDHYAALCDLVHLNMASQRVAMRAVGETTVLRHPTSGGELIFPRGAQIVRHEYPTAGVASRLIEATAERVKLELSDSVDAINGTPETPFGEAELRQLTGHRFGVRELPARAPRGRNRPCPCGSGKTFKNCHGR